MTSLARRAHTQVTKQIRDNERGGDAKVFVIDEGKDSDTDFWKTFGIARPAKIKAAEEGGADEAIHTRTSDNGTLYRVSTASGKLQCTAVETKPYKREHLDTNDAFILDNGASGIFVWVGKKANTDERLHSMKMASDFLTSKG